MSNYTVSRAFLHCVWPPLILSSCLLSAGKVNAQNLPQPIIDLCDYLDLKKVDDGDAYEIRNNCRRRRGLPLVKSKDQKERELLARRCGEVRSGIGHMHMVTRIEFAKKCNLRPPVNRIKECYSYGYGRSWKRLCSLPANHSARPLAYHQSQEAKIQQINNLLSHGGNNTPWVPHGKDRMHHINRLMILAQHQYGFNDNGRSVCWKFQSRRFTPISSYPPGKTVPSPGFYGSPLERCLARGGVIDAIWD